MDAHKLTGRLALAAVAVAAMQVSWSRSGREGKLILLPSLSLLLVRERQRRKKKSRPLSPIDRAACSLSPLLSPTLRAMAARFLPGP